PPTRTSVAAPPEWIKQWIADIRAADAKSGRRRVYEYILDNEPALWNTTQRDVHPEPVGYDELLERTIAYGRAIRAADPDALIAGPAEWGWSNYFYSAKDAVGNYRFSLDRRAHGDVPLIEWYLRRLAEQEKKTGVRVLDVVDVHYYPQEENVYGGGQGGTDDRTAALRLRATRSLWDPTYVDESWINQPIRLLSRMREWVDKNYPGRGISIGEWNFGGQGHITGALATAEALGRFAQFGVTSAFYWTYPPEGSPSRQGFVAYRNFDGAGGRFLDWYVPSAAPPDASLFVSRSEAGDHLVAVAINMSRDRTMDAQFDLGACGALASHQAFQYVRGAPGFAAGPRVEHTGAALDQPLPPWSITVLDIRLARPMPGAVER
ncbi:MAG TPA: glycoside hydrolase family 44 protein, partial [Polyangiaceae bacterium]|nr:glycoside hydrolase family 44 protein [Polyangiaceae bacterium]